MKLIMSCVRMHWRLQSKAIHPCLDCVSNGSSSRALLLWQPNSKITPNTWAVAAIFRCWVPLGVQDTFKKQACILWRINPHTQHFLWRRIILGYPFSSRLVDGLYRIPFLACDKIPLFVFKKSHSDLQWHYHHSTFPQSPLPFIPHDFRPALNFRHVSRLKHCWFHGRGSRLDGEGTLFTLTHHETFTFGLLSLDIT